ncbi:Putative amidase AmiB2 [Alphaproteobacteria bacterium SO-S41]|nr:Putative amidase AmiB2 [Alphaproteobacteria bacterium SO-S41]
MSDFAYASAIDTAAALRLKDVSSAELVDAAIRRIERLDQKLNAVVVRDFERARADAKAADAAIAGGKTAPLLGVPLTVKESYDLAGYPTTWGIGMLHDHRAPADSELVTRLRAAGAVLLGKTNIPPALGDWQSDNPIYGRTNNPYDLTRSPGGSSGGSAAALAAGYVPLEFGSDIGGSVRIPAAFCGVYGHKPSYGVFPLGGHVPGGAAGAGVLLAVGGPLARTAEDLTLAFKLTAGSEGDVAKAWSLNLPPPRRTTLKGMRVLIVDSHPRCATANAMKQALADFAETIARQGAEVATASELLPDLGAQYDVYFPMLMTIVLRNSPAPGNPPSAHGWMDLLDGQASFRRQWAALFEAFDIVVTPAFGSAAFAHNTEPYEKRLLTIDGADTVYGTQLAWPSVATLPHLPATAFPIGFDADGLPLGAQAIGGFGEDYTTLAFAGLAGRPFVPPKLD